VFAIEDLFGVVVCRHFIDYSVSSRIWNDVDHYALYSRGLCNILDLGSSINLQSRIQMDFVGSCFGAICYRVFHSSCANGRQSKHTVGYTYS
jgi:hypothetical protein